MTVQSYVLIRTEGDSETGYGPRSADLAPYSSLHLEDVTARASQPEERPQFNALFETEPRLMLIHINRMTDADAQAMSTDPKLWMLVSKRFTVDEDGEETVLLNNRNDVFTEAERTTRIAQLANFTDFDIDTIDAWWTPDKTRFEVATKLIKYLKSLDASGE